MTKLFMIMVVGLSSVANAAGMYDGIWTSSDDMNKLTSFHQSGTSIVAFSMNNYDGIFDTGMGELKENTIRFTSLTSHSHVNAVFDVTFTSPNTFTATQVSCNPMYAGITCIYRNGQVSYGKKIF